MDLADDAPETRHVWQAFGDLMACLFGLFVLFFVWLVTVQVALSRNLEEEQAAREATAAKLESLERVLAGPLASGLVTVVDGRIGIRGAVLFERNSAELSQEGNRLITTLAPPLRDYLAQRNLSVMVSGFTDDLPVRESYAHSDNWELSTQRSLNVTRTLVAAGLPGEWIFAAGFGANHPVAPNDTEENRAKNRRVEISPVPRPTTIEARPETRAPR